MENDALSSLDPDSYERIYVCHICNGISTEPVCDNDHITDVSSIDFENLIKPTMLSNNYKHVSEKNNNPKAKICAVIPSFVNTNWQPQNKLDYLCPACGYLSLDVECKKSHDIKTLKDICNVCGAEFESMEKMMQHRTCCSPVDKYVVDSSTMTIVPACSTDRMLCSVVQPVALYLPENFASMVQKGSLGIGQYQVFAAFMDTDSSKEENMDTLSDSDFDLPQNILEWDESIDLAVLGMEDPTCEMMESYESLNEPKVGEESSDSAQIEPPKWNQTSSTAVINRESMVHEMVENRRLLCCVTCKMELLDLDTLVAHYLSHGSSTFICQFCLRRYTRSYWYKIHMKNHANELPIVCPLCDDSFLSTKLHEDHLKTVHNLSVSDNGKNLLDNQKNAFMCMECGRWLKSENHMESHRQMHDMVKGRTTQLKNQITTIDQPILVDGGANRRASTSVVSTNTDAPKLGNRKPIHVFECNICLATIKSIEEVRQHMMSHDAHRLSKCEGCSERFQTTAQMQQHKCLRYDSNINSCTDCSKVFSHPAGLPCHLKTDHQVETISCDKCQLKFKMLSTFLIHRHRCH